MKVKTVMAAGLMAVAALAPAAKASLVVTNGDFEVGGGANIENVTGWYDYNTGNFWEGAWQSNAQSFNGSNQAIFSSFESGTAGTPSADVLAGSYLYQGIGTAGVGDTGLKVNFDWGSPTDDPGGRDLGLSVSVFAYDGLGGFTAADNTDIYGASGVTLLDSATFTIPSSTAGGSMSAASATLNISGAGSQSIFLRFNGYLAGTTESWPTLDNVSVQAIPEPATVGLVGLFGAGLLFVRRRFMI